MGLSLGVGVIVSLGSVAAPPAQAAQVASKFQLDADDMNQALVLDQNGRRIALPTRAHPGAVALPSGSVPSYLVYPVDSDDSVPKNFPTVKTGPAKAGQTTGPLHLDAAVKTQLDQALAQNGQVAVYTGKHTHLVELIAPLFGSAGTGGEGTTLIWLAYQAPANRSGSRSSTSTASSTSKVPTTVPATQALIPANITDPITKSKLIKDLQRLVSIHHGKLSNWNQQTLNALKADLGISSPRNVAPPLATSSTKAKPAAEMLDVSRTGTGTGPGTPSPAPVPEPAPVVVFGLAALALAARSRLARRSPGA